ncbi:MAG: hypothetical protein ACJ75F_06890 [Flavisolibacter sp.]|jgi:hypothetical protein
MKFIFLSVTILLSLASCTRVYYAPNTVHPALLTDKDEMRVNAIYSAGQGSELRAMDLQMAYAIQRNWGIMANGFYATNKKNDYIDKANGTYGEIAGGYFKNFKQSKWMAEVYSGIGGGWVNNYFEQNDYSRIGISKFFVQPSIGYKGPDVELAFTSRFAVVHWKVNKAQYDHPNYPEDVDYVAISPTFFAWEPGLVFRFGTKDVKAQIGFTVSDHGKRVLLDTESLMLNAGLSISLHARSNGK